MLSVQELKAYVEDTCRRFEVPELPEKVLSNAVPAIEMKTHGATPAENAPAASRIGGNPALPAALEWPKDELGRYLDFIAQVNLNDLPRGGPAQTLPTTGMLLLFANHRNQDDDFDMCSIPNKVIYVAEAVVEARVCPFEDEYPQPKEGEFFYDSRIHERLVSFAEVASIYDTDRVQELCGVALDTTEAEVYEENFGCATCDRPAHVLFPLDTHGEACPMFDEEDIPNWPILFRIDRDEQTNTMWIDGGSLYVYIAKEDLARGDFSKTLAACSSG